MSLVFIPDTVPSYIAQSTDISGSKIDKASYIGAKVYITDTGKTYVIMPDLTLEEIIESGGGTSGSSLVEVSNLPSEYPVSGSVVLQDGTASIGSVIIEEMPYGGYAYGSELVSGISGIVEDSTSTEIIPSAGSAVSIFLTTLMVTNSGDIGTNVGISSGSMGSVLWAGHASPDGGGFSVSFPSPLMFEQGDGVYLNCEMSGSIAVIASAAGYKA